MINKFNEVAEIKTFHLKWAPGKLDLLLACFWTAAHDTFIYCQKMYVAGIPVAFIFLALMVRVVLRSSFIGKILPWEFSA